MKKFLSVGLYLFYDAIILYLFFGVLHIDLLENYGIAMLFELLGMVILGCVILGNVFFRSIKVGYFVPLIMVTIVYLVLLHVTNLMLVMVMNSVLFLLLNLVFFFVYCLVSIPMFLMGKR